MLDELRLVGPFGHRPRLAVAVSGGADSTALALLAREWVQARGGTLLGLIVDHGLRDGSPAEAALVRARLQEHGVPARVLTLTGVGPDAAAARQARYAALEAACGREGIVHLLLGHHAADQAETLQIRALAASGASGFAGMARLRETHRLRLLRPLLGIAPERLRAMLTERGAAWLEDPSNFAPHALRGRLRRLGNKQSTSVLAAAAVAAGRVRCASEKARAVWLAANVTMFPEGYALVPPGPLPAAALAALLQSLAGADYAPAAAAVAQLAARPRAATLGGIRLVPAGRSGPGWLLVREATACGAAVPAVPGAVWDRRFRLMPGPRAPEGALIGALGDAAARFRRRSGLPAAVLQGLPAIRMQGRLVSVPHIGYPDVPANEALRLQFSPPRAVACAHWMLSDADEGCAEAVGILCSDGR